MLKYEFHSSEECLLIQEVKKKIIFYNQIWPNALFQSTFHGENPNNHPVKNMDLKEEKNESKKKCST